MAIEQYASDHQLDWVDDESNTDERYDRNFLRHQVTPLLNTRWPGIRKAVTRSAALCAEQEALLQELLAEQLGQAMSADQSLDIMSLHPDKPGSERRGKATATPLACRRWCENALAGSAGSGLVLRGLGSA